MIPKRTCKTYEVSSMNLKIKTILSLFVSILFVIPIYIVLHEGGHTLIAVLYGAHITKFSIWGAYMSYEGGTFTPIGFSLLNIAGMLLPVLVAIIYMLTYRSNVISIPYRIFSYIFVVAPICSVLAWVFIPILYLADKAPQYDDVTRFMNHSGLSPWVVSFTALIIFACCIFIAWKKKIIQNFLTTVRNKAPNE